MAERAHSGRSYAPLLYSTAKATRPYTPTTHQPHRRGSSRADPSSLALMTLPPPRGANTPRATWSDRPLSSLLEVMGLAGSPRVGSSRALTLAVSLWRAWGAGRVVAECVVLGVGGHGVGKSRRRG